MTYGLERSSGPSLPSLLFLLGTLFALNIGNLSGQAVQVKPSLLSADAGQNRSLPLIHPEAPVEGELRIIAVRVEFQPDSKRFTSGNGTFRQGSIPYLEDPGTHIDPLPHDKQYFESHLEFAKNYFETVSGGRLTVTCHLLEDIYRLDKPMEAYSPIGINPGLSPLAALAKDTWELVQQDGDLSLPFGYGSNTAFLIFHAGVGRDIELTGTSLDKTPQDIPSVYLDMDALKRFLNDPAFAGFEIDGGNLLVNNTLILPRTLTRSGEDTAGDPFLLPLSLNGMLTAQIGSHLGLPDLFHTQTGESGIGRFGLMDGAGIFSYNGLFPPELSAWEKMYLGWADVFEPEITGSEPVSLPAASLRQEGSIAKIPISSKEYFLLENRHRDPRGQGIGLTIRRPDGSLTTQFFTNRDTGFTNQESGFDRLLEPGVVIDVSNFDFSLPGGLAEEIETMPVDNRERELNGGILIWHIDESVIEKTPGHEGINDNPDRRGVHLVEADGARDIGRPAPVGISQNEVNGSAFDFWWKGNNASVVTRSDTIRLYQNRFGPDTIPSNHSNTGAPSFFEIYDFSGNIPVATFSIREAQPFNELYTLSHAEKLSRLLSFTPAGDPYWQRYPLAMQPYFLNDRTMIMIPGQNGIRFYDPDVNRVSDAVIETGTPLQQPFPGFRDHTLTVAPNPLQTENTFVVTSYRYDGETASVEWNLEAGPNRGFISSGQPSILDLDGTRFRVDAEKQHLIEHPERQWISERMNGYQSRIEEEILKIEFPGGTTSFPLSLPGHFSRIHTGLFTSSDGEYSFYLLTDGRLSIITPDTGYGEETTIADSDFLEWPAFVDFTRNGSADILYLDQTKNQLVAKNLYGSVLPGFPITPPEGVHFSGTPLIADLNGNGSYEIVITGQDDYSLTLRGYNESGDPLPGFPLYVGGVSQQPAQPVHALFVKNKLIALSHSGDLKVWEFPGMEKAAWETRYGNNPNNKVSGFIDIHTSPAPQFTLLNRKETYNWPNPAGDETYLRFHTREPADIRIKITTVSGRLIYNREIKSRAGIPEELLIDTSSWSSGGYFALVEARNGSTKEQKMIKIAIVK